MGRIADFWDRVDGLDRRIAGRSEPKVEEREGTWWSLPGGYGYSTSSEFGGGVEKALANAATWACIDVIADAVSRTPFNAIRGRNATDRQFVDPQPILLTNPSGVVLHDVWRSQLAWALLTDGNSFGRIVSMGRNQYPTQVELLDPSTVKERKVTNGVKHAMIDNRRENMYPSGDIWHVPGRMVPAGSPYGLSPITYANKVIGSSLSAEDFSYQFFTGGGHPTAIYYADKELNAEQAQQIKDSDRRARAGGNREPMVAGSGLRRETIQLDPNETQFIDLMRFNVEQACRFWRVPPSMVYASVSGQNVTYANVSDADLSYLKNTLDGYLVRLEAAFTDLLPRPQYVRANRDAVLRSDQKTRYANYQIGIRNGWRNRNEIRALEDEPPIPVNGDDYVWPPVGQGAGMDSKPPSTGGVVEEGPSTDTVTPAPAAPPSKSK